MFSVQFTKWTTFLWTSIAVPDVIELGKACGLGLMRTPAGGNNSLRVIEFMSPGSKLAVIDVINRAVKLKIKRVMIYKYGNS